MLIGKCPPEPRRSLPESRPASLRPRIEGLSDLIFGLALSIGAIQFLGNAPHTQGQLVTDLAAFGFSFLILINVWNRYTTVMSAVPVETTGLIRLNMLLLFLVAIEPYLFNLLVSGTVSSPFLEQSVSSYYGLDIGGMNLVLGYFIHILTQEERGLVPKELVGRLRHNRDSTLLSGVIFVMSAIPALWYFSIFGTPFRIVLWILAFPIAWISRAIGERM